MKKLFLVLLITFLIFVYTQDDQNDINDNQNGNDDNNQDNKNGNDDNNQDNQNSNDDNNQDNQSDTDNNYQDNQNDNSDNDNFKDDQNDSDNFQDGNNIIVNFPESEYVIEVNDDTIDDLINKNSHSLIYFYKQNYEECQYFVQPFINIAKKYKEEGTNILFGRINLSLNKETIDKYSITSFPTILLFIDGVKYEYTFLLEESLLIKFIEKRVVNPIIERKNGNEINAETINTSLYFVGTFSPENDKEKYENLKEIAFKYADFFDIYNCEECKSYYGNEFTLIKNGPSEDIIKYDNTSFTKESFEFFIRKYYRYNAEQLTGNDIQFIQKFNQTIIVYIRKKDNEVDKDKDEIFWKLNEQYEGKYIITYADIYDELISDNVKLYFNVEEYELPLVKLYDPISTDFYIYKGDITLEKMIDFITKYENNEIVREKKSELITKQDNDLVFYLVGKNFYDEIVNGSLNYLVLFGSYEDGWDNQTSDFYYSLTYLSKKYKKLNDFRIKFGFINLAYNEIDEKIEQLPALALYVNGRKNTPVFYNGKNEFGEIEKWFSNILGWKEIPHYDQDDIDNDDDTNVINDDSSSQKDADLGDL